MVELKRLGDEIKTTGSLEEWTKASNELDNLYMQRDEFAESPEAQTFWNRRMQMLDECMNKLAILARETFALALRGYTDMEIIAQMGGGSAVSIRRRISDAKERVSKCATDSARGMA